MKSFWKRQSSAPLSPPFASHIAQDRWVSGVFNGQRDGYFLDFGAFDGLDMSNTVYLERELGWRGICVEPNPTYFPQLCAARSAICVNAALWPRSRELIQLVDAHGLSSLAHLKDGDSNKENRTKATRRVVGVDTINPTELLERFEAPATIQYMSLDTEGSEYDILTSLDLERYDILLMTIENDCSTERKSQLREYLSRFGYIGMQMSYDDFFFKKDRVYPVSPVAVAKSLGCLDEVATSVA